MEVSSYLKERGFNMKHYILALILGSILAVLLVKPLGKYWDMEMGDYKKHNKMYNESGEK